MFFFTDIIFGCCAVKTLNKTLPLKENMIHLCTHNCFHSKVSPACVTTAGQIVCYHDNLYFIIEVCFINDTTIFVYDIAEKNIIQT